MGDQTIRLAQPGPDELLDWIKPANAAFGEALSAEAFEHGRRLLEMDRVIGAKDGDRWVATAAAYSFRLTVPGGREVGAPGLTDVSVAPSHRRRGILRAMMTWVLDQAVERGEPVAILWASESAIYQRLGYGIGTLQSTFDIERTRIRFTRPVEPIGRMRIVDRDEALTLIPPVYEAIRRRTPGAVSRNEGRWANDLLFDAEWMQRGNGTKFMAVLEVDGEVRGYVLYRVLNQWDDRGPDNVVVVLEVIGLDHASERTIWSWVMDLDLAGHVRGQRGPVPHPLLLELTEPRRMGLTIRDALLIRIVDLRAALEGRGYAAPGSLTFDLTDVDRPLNDGRWRLEVADDGGATLTAAKNEPDLRLDTSDLATVYLGAFRFADLAFAGRVTECRPRAIAAADQLFATGASAWCSMIF